jgi:hypothetical protein
MNRPESMDLPKNPMDQKQAEEWARALVMETTEILRIYPNANPDNVRHTLILMQQPPLERLQRSLIRGRTTVNRK